jgi:hypothetical protein
MEMAAVQGRSRWQIVPEAPADEATPVRFAVLRDDRRVAWGLRDQAAARRWLRRLSETAPPPLAPGA